MVAKQKSADKIAANKSVSRGPLTPEAKRALAEAEARRLKNPFGKTKPKEIDGPTGPEPTRYGDWESKGIASDF